MMINTIYNMLIKVERLASNVGGWIMCLVTSAVAYLGSDAAGFAVVGVAVVIDAIWGIMVAIKNGRFILSTLLRETVNKVFIYACTLSLVMLIERSLADDWNIATRAVCALAASCELWSIFANILIIRPNTPFIRIFRKWLVGEISKKIGVEQEEFNKDNLK